MRRYFFLVLFTVFVCANVVHISPAVKLLLSEIINSGISYAQPTTEQQMAQCDTTHYNCLVGSEALGFSNYTMAGGPSGIQGWEWICENGDFVNDPSSYSYEFCWETDQPACGSTHYICTGGVNTWYQFELYDGWHWNCANTDGSGVIECSEGNGVPQTTQVNATCGSTHYNCDEGTEKSGSSRELTVGDVGYPGWEWYCENGGHDPVTPSYWSDNYTLSDRCYESQEVPACSDPAAHYDCATGTLSPGTDTEYNVNGTATDNSDMTHYWTWTCEVPGYYPDATCSEDMNPVCNTTTKNLCVTGKPTNSAETPTDWTWDCLTGTYSGSTLTQSCSLSKVPACSDPSAHYTCDEGTLSAGTDIEYNVNGTAIDDSDMTHYWTWTCEVPGYYPDATCSEDMEPACSTTIANVCDTGKSKNPAETPTDWTWDCKTGTYLGGTKTTACTLKKPPVCDNTVKWGCTNGTDSDRVGPTKTARPIGLNMFDNVYTWKCNVADAIPASVDCELKIELCANAELGSNQKCCRNDPFSPDGVNPHESSYMGVNELACANDWKCFNRTVCADVFGNIENGEDGDASITCQARLRCEPPSTVGIANVCDATRINNNCRDECHPSIIPRPAWCDGGGGITGTCGGAFGTCATGWPLEVNPFLWYCMGSDNNSALDDAMCPAGGVGKCGATYNTCTPGTPEIIDATTWRCLGTDNNSTLDDVTCDGLPIDGVCGDLPGSCADGVPDPANPIVDNAAGIQWNCLGENGGSSATCEIKNGLCGTSPYPANIYECDFSVPSGIAVITPPGYTGNTFEWSCLGETYGTDDSCTYTCPGEQVIDADLNICIDPPPDLCLNIADRQNPVPGGMTRFPSGNCCTDPQVWDTTVNTCVDPLSVSCAGSPDPAETGKVVTWTSTVTGGLTTKTYTWSGTDALTGNTANTSKTYATTGVKTANISVTSGSQSLADTCTIQINICSATAPTANSVICTDGPAPATNGADGVLAAACNNTVSCDWVCDTGFIKKNTLCAPKPDLTAGAPSPNTATINVAQIFTATISNADGSTEVGFNNFFQISTGPGMTGTVVNKTSTPMAALAAGGTDTTTTSHTFTAMGTYYIRACADKSNAVDVGGIDESNELNNCGPETIVVVPALPTIDTPTDTDVTSASATLGATVTSVGFPSPLDRRGVCWGTNINPSMNSDGSPAVGTLDCQAEGGVTTGIFTVAVSGLSPETTYYYRGYAQNTTGTAYTGSAITTITTPPGPSGSITATDCAIPAGSSSCDVVLTWTTANLTANPTNVTTPTNVTVSTLTSATNVAYTVDHGSRYFFLNHNAVELDNVTATAECALGTRWDADAMICVLVSCPEGTTYVADSTKLNKCCTAAEIDANIDQCGSTVVCDNDGICETGEGCLCPDCDGSGTDASCEPGLECDGTVIPGFSGAACCPAGTTWDTVTKTCLTNAVPTVISPTYTDVTSTSVILGANVTSLGIPSLITDEAQGTCYSLTPNPGLGVPGSSCEAEGTTRLGVFTHLRSGLVPETTYHYRGYATNSFGTGYSPDDTFITPPGPSGTLTATDCTIPAGSSSCDTTLVWTTTNPITTSEVTTPTSISVATANSGTTTYSVDRGSRIFYLYNNAAEIKTATANAECAFGSIWDEDSLTCLAPTPPTIDLPTATNIKSASVTLGARVTSIGSPPPLFRRGVCWSTSPNPTLNPTDGLGGEVGTECRAAPPPVIGVFTVDVAGLSPGTTYYYRGYAQNATGIAYTGDVTTFEPPVGPWGEISASPMICKILAGRSSCNTALTWTTTDTTGDVAVTTPGRTDVGTTTSGTNVSASIDYDPSGNGRNFFLYHMGDKLDEVNVQAECNTGSSWDGSICFDPTADPSGILTATDCEILENQSTCLISLEWDTVNLALDKDTAVTTPTSNTDPTPITIWSETPSGAATLTGTETYLVTGGQSRNFFLYHNTFQLAMATATASCENFTGWDSVLGQCKKYTLTYDENGGNGTVPTTQFPTYIPGADITVSDEGTLSKLGYGFDGWNTAPDGSGTAYSAGATLTITANTTLYAQWKTNVFTVTVIGEGTVTSDDANIDCPAAGSCAYDYPNGSLVTLTAALGGATKITWSGCDAVSGPDNEICDITVNSDTTITLIFTGPRDGCFADSTSAINLDNYILGPSGTNGLVARINSCKLGYGFTDPDREAQTKSFRTKLAGNINKYITSRYCPTKIVSNMMWNANYINDPAFIDPIFGDCSDNDLDRNSNGYFYYQNSDSLMDALLTVGEPAQNPNIPLLIDRPTVLYVVGADINIHNDITYSTASGTYPSLVIIVQKDSAGNGGDIYVDPGVTKINATLIADGSLTNGVGNDPKNWIAHPTELENPLLINGRLLTYNLRGGSLKPSLLPRGDGGEGADVGICANSSTIPVVGTSGKAASQDLERFRWVPIGIDTQCSLYVTDNVPARKPDILTILAD